jgi:thioredoxin 1
MEFTDKNFNEEVLKSKVPALVDFWAPWCGPCRMQGPIIEELEKDYAGKPVKIGKLNVDENGDVAQKYGVMSIPTLLLFKDGKIVEQMVGVQSKESLKSKLDALMK